MELADDLEELIVRELCGGLSGPLASFERSERSGGEASQALTERKLTVHPIEAFRVFGVVTHDPVEVIRFQALEVSA